MSRRGSQPVRWFSLCNIRTYMYMYVHVCMYMYIHLTGAICTCMMWHNISEKHRLQQKTYIHNDDVYNDKRSASFR